MRCMGVQMLEYRNFISLWVSDPGVTNFFPSEMRFQTKKLKNVQQRGLSAVPD